MIYILEIKIIINKTNQNYQSKFFFLKEENKVIKKLKNIIVFLL